MSDFQVETLTPEPFAYLTITAKMPEIPKAMGDGFSRLSELFAKAKVTMSGMPMCHYTQYDDVSATFQLGFPVRSTEVEALGAAGLAIGETPSGRSMKATHMGPYETIEKTYQAMLAEMQAKGMQGSRDMWETYFSPPGTPPEQIKTEVIWPIQSAA